MKQKLLTLFTLLLTVCSGAWADEVTVGRTYTLSNESTKPTTYTIVSVTNATVTQQDGTVAMATGTQTIYVGNTSYSSQPKEVCYRNHDGSDHVKSKNTAVYAGFKLVVADGYQLTVSSIDLALGTTANFCYQMEIVDNEGESLWSSSSYEMTNYNKATVTNGSQSLAPASTLTLTGTVYARLYYWYNGTGKYMVPTNFSISGDLASTSSGPSVSSFTPASGSTVKSGTTVTVAGSTGSTVYYKWSASALTAAEVVSSGTAGESGAATVTTTGISSSATTLYAAAVKDETTSDLATATYTIDDTAPTLSSSTPADAATGVAISGNIVLTFSENVTIADASKFSLSGGTLNTASATVSGAAVTIPYSGLDMNTEYTLSTAAGAVQDAAGNTNVALSNITFTTLNDATPPTLSNSNPADGATGITSAVNVTLTFSENVVLSGDFTLTPSGATVGTPTVSDATITIPIKGMSYGTAYTLGLAKEGLADEAGNNLAADIALGFTTITAPATTKTWNFKAALNSTDKSNFEADGTNWTDDYSKNKRYLSKGTKTSEVLMANGSPIEKTAGILFTATGDDQIRLGDDNLMIKKQSPITIPNLKENDEVTIVFSSGNNSATRTISVSNASLVYGSNSSPNYNEVTAVYKVSADGNVTITPSDWMRFYGITVATNSNNAVTVSSAAYATIVTTGNVDFSKTPGVTAYKATISGTSLVLSEVTAAPANTPLIIAADAAAYVLAITTDTPSAVEDNDLQAANTDITQADATDGKTIYVLNKVDDTVGFYKLSATGTLKAGKAYVELDSTTDASALNFFISDEHETDGVKAVNALEVMTKDGIYDMQGRKVIRPSKGLYIVNGKKVVIK